MKVQKVTRAQGEYARKGVDINPGDKVKIVSEGEWITGDFREQFVIKVETKTGAKNVRFNQTTINILHDEFGEDTTNWLEKEVVIRMKKDVVAGKKVDIYYFVTPNWDFDEYRELVNVKKTISEEDRVNAELAGSSKEEDLPF